MRSILRCILVALLVTSAVSASPRKKQLPLAEPDPMSDSIGVSVERAPLKGVPKLANRMVQQPAVEVFYGVLLPGMAEKSNFARNLGGQSVYAADIKNVAKDTATENAFWTKARDKVFKEAPGWQAQSERQLEFLSEQDPG